MPSQQGQFSLTHAHASIVPRDQRFASAANTQLPLFISRYPHPGAFAQDVLKTGLSCKPLMYPCPPWPVIGLFLQRFSLFPNLRCMLVVPLGPGCLWWPRLLQLYDPPCKPVCVPNGAIRRLLQSAHAKTKDFPSLRCIIDQVFGEKGYTNTALKALLEKHSKSIIRYDAAFRVFCAVGLEMGYSFPNLSRAHVGCIISTIDDACALQARLLSDTKSSHFAFSPIRSCHWGYAPKMEPVYA